MSVYFSFGDIFGIEEIELKEWPYIILGIKIVKECLMVNKSN